MIHLGCKLEGNIPRGSWCSSLYFFFRWNLGELGLSWYSYALFQPVYRLDLISGKNLFVSWFCVSKYKDKPCVQRPCVRTNVPMTNNCRVINLEGLYWEVTLIIPLRCTIFPFRTLSQGFFSGKFWMCFDFWVPFDLSDQIYSFPWIWNERGQDTPKSRYLCLGHDKSCTFTCSFPTGV